MSSRPLTEKNDKIIGSITGTVRAVGRGPMTGRSVAEPKIDADVVAKKAPGAFRTISEVADDLGVQQHVLRFWETKFSQIRPLKRGGGRRYYRPEDLALLKRIHHLLYTEGYTIKGVQKLLREKGRSGILQPDEGASVAASATNGNVQSAAQRALVAVAAPAAAQEKGSDAQRVLLQAMLGELKEIRSLIKP